MLTRPFALPAGSPRRAPAETRAGALRSRDMGVCASTPEPSSPPPAASKYASSAPASSSDAPAPASSAEATPPTTPRPPSKLPAIRTPPRPVHGYAVDSPGTPPAYAEPPPVFPGGRMPPPPVAPIPNAHPSPPNARVYAHVYMLRFAHRVLASQHGGDPDASSFGWHASVPRVRVAFTVYIDGREVTHDVDWDGGDRLPPDVADYIQREPIPTFASPALGLYHPEARGADEKIEDAALVAAMDYVTDWAAAEHKVGLDPYRDIGRVRCVFDLVKRGGGRVEHKHVHEGGPDDRMNAFRAAALRVRGW